MSFDRSKKPSWTPEVTVVGIGATGRTTLDNVRTETVATLLTDPRPGVLSSEIDFLFLSADLTESGVASEARSILPQTDAVVVLFGEGLHSRPDYLMEEVDLLVPVDLQGVPRKLFAPFVADLFEAMLPLTARALGKGDLMAVMGENRVGKLHLEPLTAETGSRDLTPGVTYETAAQVLLFYCGSEKQSPTEIRQYIDKLGFGDDMPVLWDQRLHPRYIGTPHLKYLITVPAGDNVTWDR